jgi:hypothetical protein
MADDRTPDRTPDRPRSEPEIIPPGEDAAFHEHDRIWMRYDDGFGVHRIFIARPGWPSILLGLVILGAIVAALFLVIAGVLLLWLPILIGGVVLALLLGPLRYHWHRLQDWLAGRR